MKTFIHYFLTGIFILCLFYMPGCKKEENIRTKAEKPEKELLDYTGGNSSQNRRKIVHLSKDTVYTMKAGAFTREEGEQLIIEAGTVIKIDPVQRPEIIIKPGGVIIANGTSANPIVFTSGDQGGNQKRNWGGITISGKSSDNSANPNAGPDDFSGSLNYVRVEFAGLVFNGVGNRTTVENVQVSYAEERASFQIKGGTFNARNLVSYACGGPADFYITMGYTGKMQNVLAHRHPFFGSAGNSPSNAIAGVFIENNPYDPQATPYTHPVISNLSVIGPDLQNGSAVAYSDTSSAFRSAALVTAGNAFFQIRNSLFLGFPVAAWYIEDALTAFNVNFNHAQVTYSIFHCNDGSRAFYIREGVYFPNTSVEFKGFILREQYHNKLFDKSAEFMLQDPFNYDVPKPSPAVGSPVLEVADFSGSIYNDAFFNKVTYIGAVGGNNWLNGWTNFTPLKTNYNFPG
jgi:hypothetical protein